MSCVQKRIQKEGISTHVRFIIILCTISGVASNSHKAKQSYFLHSVDHGNGDS